MFHYISGTLTHKASTFAVIDAGGVGYKIYSTVPSLNQLGEINSRVKMFTYLRVAEGIFDLYGFATNEELNMFEMLLGVSGVGAKVATQILSAISPANFAMAVVTNDTKLITQAQGVGPKVAQRIILELKDKFKNLSINDIAGGSNDTFNIHSGDSDALNALLVLGFSAREAQIALANIDPNMELDEIIKQALKNMASK